MEALTETHHHKWISSHDYSIQEYRCFACWSAAVYIIARRIWVVSHLGYGIEECDELPITGELTREMRKMVKGIQVYRIQGILEKREGKSKTGKRIAAYVRAKMNRELKALDRAQIELARIETNYRKHITKEVSHDSTDDRKDSLVSSRTGGPLSE